MNANNAIMSNSQKKPVKFSAAITSESMQNLIAKSVPDAKAAARFTGTLISIVNGNDKLRTCEPTSIITAALRGEGMGLILGHGYYVVPYGDKAVYQLSYKGYISLAMSTGMYADIDCVDVREGELTGLDPRKCKPSIDFSKYGTLEEREQHPVIGYYAYFELKDGTFRYEYWNTDKILRHADRYSKAFSLKTYNEMISGKMNPADVEKLRKGSPWYDVGGGQIDMMMKTVLRRLLNSGYAPLSNEVRSAFRSDEDDERGNDAPLFVSQSNGDVIEGTAVDVSDATVVEEDTAESTETANNAPVADDSHKGKRTRKAKENADSTHANGESAEEKDFTKGFFD